MGAGNDERNAVGEADDDADRDVAHQGAQAQQALSSGLAVKLQALDLRELFPGQASAELDVLQQAYCMTAVGAALRQEAD